MLHAYGSAVQSNTHAGAGLIELGVIRLRRDHIPRRLAGDGIGNQSSHQQPRDRCIAVGKVEEILIGFFVGNGVAVHSLPRRRIKFHAFESGQVEAPGVLRGHGVNSNAEQGMRESLIHLHDVFVCRGDVLEEARITDTREFGFFLV